MKVVESLSHYSLSLSLGGCPSFLLCRAVTGSLWVAINSLRFRPLSLFLSPSLNLCRLLGVSDRSIADWGCSIEAPQPTVLQCCRPAASAQQINSAWRASISPAKSKTPRVHFRLSFLTPPPSFSCRGTSGVLVPRLSTLKSGVSYSGILRRGMFSVGRMRGKTQREGNGECERQFWDVQLVVGLRTGWRQLVCDVYGIWAELCGEVEIEALWSRGQRCLVQLSFSYYFAHFVFDYLVPMII